MSEDKEIAEYIHKNLKALMPYLLRMESVKQLVLWHGRKK